MRVFWILLFLPLCSCTEDNDLSLNLKHMIKSSYQKPSKECSELGKVAAKATADLGFTRSYRKTLNSALKKTYKQGGNYLHIQVASQNGRQIQGTAFYCRNFVAAAANSR